MKQGVRLVLRPDQFFNQLQWSRHHGFILFVFLLIAAIETHVGKDHTLFATYSRFLANQFHMSYDVAIWLTVSAKLFFLVLASTAIANVVWFIGNLIGESSSRRVLVRRLAIVFTVALAAYTAGHLESSYPWMGTASLFLYVWSSLLGFLALREQFVLTVSETAILGVVTSLLVIGSWIGTHRTLSDFAHKHMNEVVYHQNVVPKTTGSHRF